MDKEWFGNKFTKCYWPIFMLKPLSRIDLKRLIQPDIKPVLSTCINYLSKVELRLIKYSYISCIWIYCRATDAY